MNEMKKIAERLGGAKSILCLTHIHGDGDGLGAMVAIASAGQAAGKDVELYLPEHIPWRYKFLFNGRFPALSEPGQFEAMARRADVVLLLDTCSLSQLGDLAETLAADWLREKLVVIDHHTTSDDIGSVRWIDPAAASAGLMTMELLEHLAWPMISEAALALATAIVSDTGWLRFSNTDGRVLRAVARLIDAGVQPAELYDRIYQTDRVERLKLLERLLGSMELYAKGKLAVMSLYKSDFQAIGARHDETENLINEALRIASVEVALLLVENPDQVRVSFRSRKLVNVAKIAAHFGGGGHARAAGLRSDENLDTLRDKLIQAILKEF
jgi:phosphoesterase RecJ-like protein